MNTNPDVETWFAERDHPLEAELRRVREIVLGTDARIEECIKWKTPTFMFNGNIASFNPAKNFVSLMFHRGAEIPGAHPRLDGTGDVARVMRFADIDEIELAKAELEAVVAAWCAWKEG